MSVTDEELQKYLSSRFVKMLNYYDKRAMQSKRAYRRLSIYVVVASSLLAPIVTLDLGKWRFLTAILSSSIAIAAGVLSHYKFHEDWLRYRSTWDCLRREQSLHMARLTEYANHLDPNALFVLRVEAIFAKEGAEWLQKHSCEQEMANKQKHKTERQIS